MLGCVLGFTTSYARIYTRILLYVSPCMHARNFDSPLNAANASWNPWSHGANKYNTNAGSRSLDCPFASWKSKPPTARLRWLPPQILHDILTHAGWRALERQVDRSRLQTIWRCIWKTREHLHESLGFCGIDIEICLKRVVPVILFTLQRIMLCISLVFP